MCCGNWIQLYIHISDGVYVELCVCACALIYVCTQCTLLLMMGWLVGWLAGWLFGLAINVDGMMTMIRILTICCCCCCCGFCFANFIYLFFYTEAAAAIVAVVVIRKWFYFLLLLVCNCTEAAHPECRVDVLVVVITYVHTYVLGLEWFRCKQAGVWGPPVQCNNALLIALHQ